MLVDVWQPPSTFCNTLNFDEEVQCPQVVLKGHCIIIRNKQAPPCRAWLQYYEEKEDSDGHTDSPWVPDGHTLISMLKDKQAYR